MMGMRTMFGKLLVAAAALAASAVLRGEETPLAISGDCRFSVDTKGGVVLVKTADAVPLSFGNAQKLTAASEDSASVQTLIESAEGFGKYAWTPESGGYWFLTNSTEGAATFLVRYSLFPETQGKGTADDPVKIVDGEEIAELIAAGTLAEGSVFSLGGMASVDGIAVPEGLAIEGLSDGVYRFTAVDDGMLYRSSAKAFIVDSKKSGPDRRWRLGQSIGIGYSGDNWTGAADAQSTLEIVSPAGTVEEKVFSGTGVDGFDPAERGVYRLTLTSAAGKRESQISVLSAPLTIKMR